MLDEEINENEALYDSQSSILTSPSSSTCSDMPKVNHNNFIKHRLSNIDVSDVSLLETKQIPIKVLTINGKCSHIFKSALEECVEDCILEFPDDQDSIYVSKSRETIQIPNENNRNSINTRSSHQYNAQTQIGSGRTSTTNNLVLPSVNLATSARMRHQLVNNISERKSSTTPKKFQSERPSILPNELISSKSIPEMTSASLPLFPSNKKNKSYHDRQKNYRLSDLVMLGPEYFADVFHLSHHPYRTTTKTELDRIKQDLFHRYLWTQKPQVSCRIRPLSIYTRTRTLII
ncbi:unnamed protein product [Adineta steineri]|uniref:Uncharacterized protein n=1 Tax=Adineta steineri TaxID=433720 RepID=A0A818TGP1_9BILA|nr:unnamed protein product [Adineta steineri]